MPVLTDPETLVRVQSPHIVLHESDFRDIEKRRRTGIPLVLTEHSMKKDRKLLIRELWPTNKRLDDFPGPANLQLIKIELIVREM